MGPAGKDSSSPRMVKIFERVFPPVFIFLLSKTGVNPKGLQGLTDYSD
jgi:hypothetical protein